MAGHVGKTLGIAPTDLLGLEYGTFGTLQMNARILAVITPTPKGTRTLEEQIGMESTGIDAYVRKKFGGAG